MQNKYFILLMAFICTAGVLVWYIDGKSSEPVTEAKAPEYRWHNETYSAGQWDNVIIGKSMGTITNLDALRTRYHPYKYNKCKMIFYKSTDNKTWIIDTSFTAETMRLFIDTTNRKYYKQ